MRGLNGDFNRTRLNGLEALATAGSNDAGSTPNRSRAFDYNTFASELFSSLKVQKTPSAETDEGSLGATIDLTTGKPFDYKKGAFALSVEDTYYDQSKKHNPRLAGLISRRFFDGSVGLLISGAYAKSDNEIDSFQRAPGAVEYAYRGTDFAGNENPQRAGFAAPTGTTFGTVITNPQAIALQTGSDPAAYAKLFPGAPYNTPGRFDDSTIRIPALATLQQQNVKYERMGFTGAFQWNPDERTTVTIDGAFSRLKNDSVFYQVQTIGLNRNNTNTAYNTAIGRQAPITARGLYPGICTPNAGSDLVPSQDCGESLYGTTPVFSTAFNSAGVLVPAVLGSAAVTPGATNPATANTFSVNPNNLDPYDYYNNPNSVGYIPSTNGLAYRGELIGRPSTRLLDINVTNGVADYLKLQNLDFRSAADGASYTTTFWQGSFNLKHEFSDRLRMDMIYGQSRSTNYTTGLLVEYNRTDSPGVYTFDARGDGDMPVVDLGFDAANPANWDTVKGLSSIRHFRRIVRNTFRTIKSDFDYRISDQFNLGFGMSYRQFDFDTDFLERNSTEVNPTLKEARTTSAATGQLTEFGQGLNVPDGTTTKFWTPSIDAFRDLFQFDCNCINKWGDWRLTDKRSGNPNRYAVSEQDRGVYVQLDFNLPVFGRTLRGNIGAREAFTKVNATGNTQNGRQITGNNTYKDFLPSLNLNYEPVQNVILRLAASKVIARPLLGNLSPITSGLSIPSDGSTSGARLTVGNPKLSPFRSTNVDASIEWYFAKGGLLSVAAFNKEIASFPQTIIFTTPLSSILSADAIAAIRAGTTNAQSLAYVDNNLPFDVRQYRDAPGGYLRGLEVTYQQDFTFLPGFLKNFGALLNYTYIKSELTYILDPGAAATATTAAVPQTTGKAPFLGVSPQAFNATLYYQAGKFRARASGAYRKGYSTTFPIVSGPCSPGIVSPVPTSPGTIGASGNAPGGYCTSPLINDFISSKATFNLDASASYAVSKWLSFNVEAQNLTNQTNVRLMYQDSPTVQQYSAAGRIYRAGARIRF